MLDWTTPSPAKQGHLLDWTTPSPAKQGHLLDWITPSPAKQGYPRDWTISDASTDAKTRNRRRTRIILLFFLDLHVIQTVTESYRRSRSVFNH